MDLYANKTIEMSLDNNLTVYEKEKMKISKFSFVFR